MANKLKYLFSDECAEEIMALYRDIIAQSLAERSCVTCRHCIPGDITLPGYIESRAECRFGGLAEDGCDRYEVAEKFIQG